jgi:cation diffusion facilitator CzcD-associated flavoprotein CzcO
MNDICIIGAGVTGLSLLLLLQESGADLSKVAVIDPYFDGGDLARRWTAVKSNTPWSKTANALANTCPSLIQPCEHAPGSTTKVADIAHHIRAAAASGLKRTQQIQGLATKANYVSDAAAWTVQVLASGKPIEIKAKKLVLAPGGDSKALDLPIPSIPLDVAIDANRLLHYVKPGQRVLVFGTMHSGTLVIRNLASCGAQVTAYYNSQQPFYWARDGVYDGIKEEAAEIADDIVSGKIPVDLVPVENTSRVIRTSQHADWVVYAMGFQARNSINVCVNEVSLQHPIKYNGTTGQLNDTPPAWGFGIAYPNLAPDGIHWDVSVAAFLEHMKQQVPSLLQGL